jgi:DNA-directed RNA polymerase specialized sigma24 family protein
VAFKRTAVHAAATPPAALDAESRRWLDELSATGPTYEDAVGRLHALLQRAARLEVASRTQSPDEHRAESELLDAVRPAIDEHLSAHQREVLVAAALNGVPIDVLAERLNTTRGALYKTLHDARRCCAPRSPRRPSMSRTVTGSTGHEAPARR